MSILNLLTKGNKKLDKTVLGWSITPIVSCLNCQNCKKDCYAMKSYRQYPNVRTAWDRNLEMAKDNSFFELVKSQLKRSRTCTAVRIHVSGDFFSQAYIDAWSKLIKCFPELNFYGYTKVKDFFNFEELTSLPNMNLVNSIADDNGINFGDADRVAELVEMGYTVCPATQGKDVVCGGKLKNSCTLCQEIEKVCFVKH